MMQKKVKRVWEAVPSGIKRAVVVTAGVVGFLLESIVDDEESPASQEVFYNHGTGKYDDGHDFTGVYYDDFPPDDHRHYDV